MAITWADRQSNLESGTKMRRPAWPEAAYIQYVGDALTYVDPNEGKSMEYTDLWDFLGTDDWETLA